MDDKDFLQHFGVIGMRWGRRKGSRIGSRKSMPHKGKVSDEHADKVAIRAKGLRRMSNADIKKINERMQLEKQYKSLTKSEISIGQKFVTDVLSDSSKQLATKYVSKYIGDGIEYLIKKVSRH